MHRLNRVKAHTLIDNGYKFKEYVDNDKTLFVKRMPLSNMKLYGEINVILPKGVISFNVVDQNGQLYAPYYNRQCHYSHRDMMKCVDRIFENEIEILNAKPSKRKNHS